MRSSFVEGSTESNRGLSLRREFILNKDRNLLPDFGCQSKGCSPNLSRAQPFIGVHIKVTQPGELPPGKIGVLSFVDCRHFDCGLTNYRSLALNCGACLLIGDEFGTTYALNVLSYSLRSKADILKVRVIAPQ